MTADLPPNPLEALLAEREWVRSLARSLVSDTSRADDVEQQTWLAAARRPPGDLSTPRAWLGTVVRNFVRLGARGDARRQVRERSSARPEAMPSAEEMVARAETQRRVVVAVLALTEPYRTAILARFFEDMAPREIAQRVGLPVETVRTHIKRGLAQLRARLDAEYGGDGKSWGLALAPLAWKGGAIVKGTHVGIAVAAVLLIGATVGVWFGPLGRGNADVASGDVSEVVTSGPVRNPRDADAVAPAVTDPSDTLAVGRSSVRGEVWFVSPEEAAADVEVRIGPAGETRSVRTDDAGRFRLDGLPTAFRGSVRVVHEGSCSAVRALAPLRDEEEVDVGILYLSPPATADVLVASFDGEPVEGAEVFAWRTPTRRASDPQADAARLRDAPEPAARGRTDDTGRVRIEGLESGVWTFSARATGLVPATSRPSSLAAGRIVGPIRIDLERGSPFTGRVIDAEGRGISGVLVWPTEQPVMGWHTVHAAAPHAMSGPDGVFAFDALRPGTYELRVQRVPAPLVTAATVRLPASAPVDVVLAGRRIVGTVRDAATGAGVPGARVSGCAGGLFNCIEATTDAEGRYVLDTVIDTSVVCPLVAAKVGYINVPDPLKSKNPGFTPSWVLDSDGETIVDLVLRRGAKLSGRVTADGVPVRGASVLGWHPPAPLLTATTDSDGRFVWDGVEQGRVFVQVSASGYSLKEDDPDAFSSFWAGGSPHGTVQVPELGEVTIEVEMERGIEVSGRVVGPDGEPVGAATVRSGLSDAQLCGDDGAFRVVASRVQGRLSVHAQHPAVGWGSWSVEWPVSGALTDVEIQLTPPARLHVQLTAADGALEGAWIQSAPPQLSPGQQAKQDWTRPQRHPVGNGGACDVPAEFPQEQLFVRAGAPGFATAVVEAAKSADGSWSAELRLERAVRLVGRAVVGGTTDPCAGAEVMIEPAQRTTQNLHYGKPSAGAVAAVADSDGRFVVEGLPAGAVFVRVQAQGHVAAETTVTLPAVGEVAFELPLGDEISGVVRFADGTPCAAGRVSASTSVDDANSHDGKRHRWFSSANTDREGRFTIASLPEGVYDVSVVPSGNDVKFERVMTSDVATGTADVQLAVERTRDGLTLSGRVVGADGSPIRNATVSAQAEGGHASGRARTREDGTFVIDGLDAAAYTVIATPPPSSTFLDIRVSSGARWLRGSVEDVRPPRDDVVVTLPLGETIEGVLVDAAGAPLPNHWVALGVPPRRLERFDAAVPGAQTDEEGRFSIGGLHAGGRWRLVEAGFPGRRDPAPLVGGEDVAAGTHGLRLTLGAFVKIRGSVLDGAGAPVLDAKIRAAVARGTEHVGEIDETGAFEIAYLDAGVQLDVVAWAAGYAPTVVKAVSSGSEGLRIVLAPGRRVSGRLTDADGQPVELAKIVLRTSSCSVSVETTTDRDGRFTATDLLAGARYRAAFVALRGGRYREISCGMVETDATDVELRSQE